MTRQATRRLAVTAVLMVGALFVSGCVGTQAVRPGSVVAVPTSTPAPSTVTVTRTTAVPARRTDISRSVELVHDYATGAVWNYGKIPGVSSVVDVAYEGATVTGRLTFSESAGRSSYRRSQTVAVTGAGDIATFEMTTRSTSTDPRTVIDVLHRSGNPHHDYLLTGDAYRAVAPTPWVTVPAVYGNGLGCGIPGRQVVCQVSADLLANQALDPSMPTNIASAAAGTGSITSAITVKQLLALDIWRLRTATASLSNQRTADLERTLIPVTLSYAALPGVTQGRPEKMTVNGTVVVGGQTIAIDLVWDESGSGVATGVDLPVPTRALYSVLTAAQVQELAALSRRSE